MEPDRRPIVITGAAGLVGQNLIPRLKARHAGPLIAHRQASGQHQDPARLHPDIRVIEADLAVDGAGARRSSGRGRWSSIMPRSAASTEAPFTANNVTATRNVLAAAKAGGVGYIVHVSSSVVNSAARDFYTETKREQEKLVVESAIPACILRPTLMFGWFDRKHLGWLARFMQQDAAVSDPRQRALPAPAALRRRFLRHHHGLHRAAPVRTGLQHLRPGDRSTTST